MPLHLQPGDPFPDFTLPDQTGTPVSLSSLGGERPLFLAFFRGHW